MRTDRPISGHRWRAVVLLGVTLSAVVVLYWASLASAAPPALPDDIARAGIIAVPVESGASISRDAALAIAGREGGDALARASGRNAYLVRMTEPLTLRGDAAIEDRLVWLVRSTDLRIPVSGPVREDGTVADGGFVNTGYVYIDALTGEWLLTRLEG